MKALIRSTLALMALAIATSGPLAAQDASIVFLDSERLRQDWAPLQQAQQRLQQQMPQLEAQADSVLRPIQAELQELALEFQQQRGTMSQQALQQQQTAIQQKQLQLQQTGRQWEQRAAQLQSQILGPPLSRINQVIDALRQERNYSFILDGSSAGIVAADPALDITDEVLSRLRAGDDPGS